MGYGLVGAADAIQNQLEASYSYLKYEQLQNKHNVYLQLLGKIHHVLLVLHICFVGAWFSQ